MTCQTCANKRVDGSGRVLALCTAVMTGMTVEQREAYDPASPCKFWEAIIFLPVGKCLLKGEAGKI